MTQVTATGTQETRESKLQDAIYPYCESMERKTRDSGETYYVCDDDTLRDLIREAHNGVFPNDWIFEKVAHMLSSLKGYNITDESDLDEAQHEVIDSLVDIYNSDLYDWAKRFSHYVDEARDAGLLEGTEDIEKQLQCGQYHQLTEIWSCVIGGLVRQWHDAQA